MITIMLYTFVRFGHFSFKMLSKLHGGNGKMIMALLQLKLQEQLDFRHPEDWLNWEMSF